MRYLTIRVLAESRESLSQGSGPGSTTLGEPDDHEDGHPGITQRPSQTAPRRAGR